MKKRLILCLVLSCLAALFLTGCKEKEVKLPFEANQSQMVQYTEGIVQNYNDVPADEAKYYLNDGTAIEKSAVSGFKLAQTTDKVGEFLGYFDTSGNNLIFRDGGHDNILCSIVAKYENRDVQVTVSFVENREYPLQLKDTKAKLVSEAAQNGFDETNLLSYIQQAYGAYQVDTSSVDAFLGEVLAAQGVYSFEADECEVSPIYSRQELLKKAAGNTGIGMGSVFVVLIFISFIISLLKFVPMLFGQGETKKASAAKKASTKAEAPAKKAATASTLSANLADDAELVAVITAAIYAAEADKGTYTTDSKDKLVVRSIRRVR